MNKFVVVDVETANPNIGSICQIGIVVYEHNQIIDKWSTLVNPEDYFDEFNIGVHGITENDIKNAPTIKNLKPKIQEYFNQGLVVSYGTFDRIAFQRNFDDFNYPWLDLTRVVRRTWSDFAYSGYGLANICKHLEIKLENHHDALSDALGAGEILLRSFDVNGFNMEQIFERAYQPLSNLEKTGGRIEISGDPNGSYFGEVVVFTGTLSIIRSEAASLAAKQGFNVEGGVTKRTTYLVKGMQDEIRLNGAEMSSKESKALGLIKKGQNIVFLTESDFFSIIRE
ncbi:transposase [Acinetobacter beijerinckii]|uniref:exonuclease domain-containing protein n=1 Tax=Acinetobacter beijerinckii TaxID=262668 RepID=UPI0023DD8757|nr:exonuclease domain-containing protein [Acinetobacter beijerinckii]MDF2419186.1 transposase [Acinetobacter beijerinckii]